jgi:hypothetical protein
MGDVFSMQHSIRDRCWLQDGDAVNKLGAELMQLFSLHSDVHQLAVDGSKAGSKKGKKAGAASAEGGSQVGAWQVCCCLSLVTD